MTQLTQRLIFYKNALPTIPREMLESHPENITEQNILYMMFMMFLLNMTLDEAWDFYDNNFTDTMRMVTDLTDNDEQFKDDYIHSVLELYADYYAVLLGMVGEYRLPFVDDNLVFYDLNVYHLGIDTLVVDIQYGVEIP